MQDITQFDRQLGGAMQMVVTHLRLGYPTRMIFEKLAQTLPQPAAGIFHRLATLTYTEMEIITELEHINQEIPSEHLRQVVTALWQHHYRGGELADRLEPVAEEIVRKAGLDPDVRAQINVLRQMVASEAR